MAKTTPTRNYHWILPRVPRPAEKPAPALTNPDEIFAAFERAFSSEIAEDRGSTEQIRKRIPQYIASERAFLEGLGWRLLRENAAGQMASIWRRRDASGKFVYFQNDAVSKEEELAKGVFDQLSIARAMAARKDYDLALGFAFMGGVFSGAAAARFAYQQTIPGSGRQPLFYLWQKAEGYYSGLGIRRPSEANLKARITEDSRKLAPGVSIGEGQYWSGQRALKFSTGFKKRVSEWRKAQRKQ